jgi:dTDP-4-dehydrorhamnose reductase
MTSDVLFTGATGQVGWELTRRAQRQGLTVTAVDRTKMDISDQAQVARAITEVAPHIVINAAAYTAVDHAESDTETAYAVNRDGAAYLAEACATHHVPLIHVSTDYVFDGAKDGAYDEKDPVAPLGVYGASKLAGEIAIRNTHAAHVIVRTAWVYGVHGHNFVKTMLRLAETRDTLQVVDDQHGSPTFAGDLADALLKIAAHLRADSDTAELYGTFHCTGGGATSWCEFAKKIFELAAPNGVKCPEVTGIPTTGYPTPAERPKNSVLNCSKINRVYGITLRPWQLALKEMLQETLERAEDQTKDAR